MLILISGAQYQLVRLEVLRAAGPASQRPTHQGNLQGLHYRIGNVVLHLEYIVQIAVVSLRPKVKPVVGADELGSHPNLVA